MATILESTLDGIETWISEHDGHKATSPNAGKDYTGKAIRSDAAKEIDVRENTVHADARATLQVATEEDKAKAEAEEQEFAAWKAARSAPKVVDPDREAFEASKAAAWAAAGTPAQTTPTAPTDSADPASDGDDGTPSPG